MATLAQGGRISAEIVGEEIERLNASWASLDAEESEEILSRLLNRDQLAQIDLFDRAQLARVIHICQESRTLSDAGRRLFGASRAKKTSTNDADRLRNFWAALASNGPRLRTHRRYGFPIPMWLKHCYTIE
jgi:transcriptional regulatory protein RtcR